MPLSLIPVLALEVLYAAACAVVGTRPGAPLWLRWPSLLWERMVHGPAPRPRPNYARIAQLERELGMVEAATPAIRGQTAAEALEGFARLGAAIKEAGKY